MWALVARHLPLRLSCDRLYVSIDVVEFIPDAFRMATRIDLTLHGLEMRLERGNP
jgi:hypothetical protein